MLTLLMWMFLQSVCLHVADCSGIICRREQEALAANTSLQNRLLFSQPLNKRSGSEETERQTATRRDPACDGVVGSRAERQSAVDLLLSPLVRSDSVLPNR